MNTEKQYKLLLIKIAASKEEDWADTMNLLDVTFGQEHGYFMARFESHAAFFDDCDCFNEEFGSNIKGTYYNWIEYISGFEAFLEKTILCQIFQRMTPDEMLDFTTKKSVVHSAVFGETIWRLTSTSGKHDFYVEPIGFNLVHDFRE